MKARINETAQTIILSLEGRIDYETSDEVCSIIQKTISKMKSQSGTRLASSDRSSAKEIIINFENLEFVGSMGITQFVQQLKSIHQSSAIVPKYCGVKSEFQKIMKAFDQNHEFDFYDDVTLKVRGGRPIPTC